MIFLDPINTFYKFSVDLNEFKKDIRIIKINKRRFKDYSNEKIN